MATTVTMRAAMKRAYDALKHRHEMANTTPGGWMPSGMTRAELESIGMLHDALEGHNGYPNYETWAVNLWLSNEESTWRHWTQVAETICDVAKGCNQVAQGIWSPKEAAAFLLADLIKQEHEENAPRPEPASVYSDLMGSALEEVDWSRVAESVLEGVGEPYDTLSTERKKSLSWRAVEA